MADVKANILLTMTSVVLKLSVRYISEPHLKWAATVLIVSWLTIILATYVVMP
jgi:antibiotic biosynthesis monooxygenase (ABM) superfamily enzyme